MSKGQNGDKTKNKALKRTCSKTRVDNGLWSSFLLWEVWLCPCRDMKTTYVIQQCLRCRYSSHRSLGRMGSGWHPVHPAVATWHRHPETHCSLRIIQLKCQQTHTPAPDPGCTEKLPGRCTPKTHDHRMTAIQTTSIPSNTGKSKPTTHFQCLSLV